MGACDFYCSAKGNSAQEAFRNAVEDARYQYGHGGYTGSIAEKNSFVMISLPEGEEPGEYAQRLIGEGDSRVDDKWGPAGCISLKDGRYLFFGWASE